MTSRCMTLPLMTRLLAAAASVLLPSCAASRRTTATLGIEPAEVAHSIDRMIMRLKVEVPAPAARS